MPRGWRRISRNRLRARRVGPECVVDPVPVGADEADGRGAHPFQLGMLLQQQEHLQQGEGIAAEDVLAGDFHVTVHGLEAPVERLDALAPAGVENRLLEVLQQHLVQARQLHDFTVVALHHVLDAEPAAAVLEPEHPGQGPLMVEQQPVLGAPGQDVQREPYPPQKTPAGLQGVELVRGEEAVVDQLAEGLRPEVASGDPGDGLDVAQAARALLDVRLEVVAGVVEPAVSQTLLAHLGFEEPPARPDPHRARSLLHPREQGRGSLHEAAVHEVGGYGDVAPRLVHALAYGADAVPDRQPDVPQEREKAPDLLVVAAAHRPAGEDEQVDVGTGMQLAAAVATGRDERATGVGVESEPAPDEREYVVDEPRTSRDERGHGLAPAEALFEARPRLGDGVADARQGRARVARDGGRSGLRRRQAGRGGVIPHPGTPLWTMPAGGHARVPPAVVGPLRVHGGRPGRQ